MPGELTDWEPDETGRRIPAKITVADFRRYYLMSFPKLADAQYDGLIQDAIDTVYGIFSPIGTLWDLQSKQIWFEKTRVCYRHLVAWYIGDMYPVFVAGVQTMGGVPLKRKKVDGVDVTFADSGAITSKGYLNLLKALESNPWGKIAAFMIRASGKTAMLRNRRFV
jgi:hypothetical protein